jgi:uncharacterized protein
MKAPLGSIISADLTAPNADYLRDFYREIMGWEVENMDMKDERGEYVDYVMKDSEGNWVGGVCHARGENLNIPPQWILYINVADIADTIEKCVGMGGKVIKESRNEEGVLQYAMIQDPAGAVLGLTKTQE